jgi:putative GTP pyrophosphokinase
VSKPPTLCGLPLNEFLSNHDITAADFKGTGLTIEELEAIATDFGPKRNSLLSTANTIANLLQTLPDVHSTKARIKSTSGLVAKIIRKKIEDSGRVISLSNYEEELTDLIGVRALHLLKDRWPPICKFIEDNWNPHEPPVAYYREGDPPDVLEAYKKANLEPKARPAGYRSIHHVIECSVTKAKRLVEIQVRSLFEEGWSEIDHNVRYPKKTDDKALDSFLMLFNSVAGTADLMGTFLMTLRDRLNQHRREVAELKSQIEKLQKVSEGEKSELLRKIATMEATTRGFFANTVIYPNTGALEIQPSPAVLAATHYASATTASTILATRRCPNGHPLLNSTTMIMNTCPTCGANLF